MPVRCLAATKVTWREFTEVDRNFIMRCLEDLRKWNDGETENRVKGDDDGMSEIFETWPERIQHMMSALKWVTDYI